MSNNTSKDKQASVAAQRIIAPDDVIDFGSLTVADNPEDIDIVEQSFEIKQTLPDALPSGCDTSRYHYVWINRDSKNVPDGIRAMMDITEAYGPVKPGNHTGIPDRFFSDGYVRVGDVVLFYAKKEVYRKYMEAMYKPTRERVERLSEHITKSDDNVEAKIQVSLGEFDRAMK